MSWVWLASSEVLESMTEPTRSAARAASGRPALECMITFRGWTASVLAGETIV